MAKVKSDLRKDFEIFSRGIQRLEELRRELDSLNTRGYEAEANSIRAKLKNVSDIPIIEGELKRLKRKISGKYKAKKKKGPNKTEREIREIKERIKKNVSLDRRQSSKLSEIPKLERQLKILKRQLEQQKKENKRKQEMIKRIDPSVDLLTNEAFDLSLNEIKAALSQRLKNKESAMQKQLDEDLKLREESFKKKYNDLEQQYHEIYEERVNRGLKKEIQRKFDNLLSEELKKRKSQLTEKELNILRDRAQKQFDEGREKLRKKFRKNLVEAKKAMKRHFDEEVLLHKHEMHQKFEQQIADEVKKLKEIQEERENKTKEIVVQEHFKNEKLKNEKLKTLQLRERELKEKLLKEKRSHEKMFKNRLSEYEKIFRTRMNDLEAQHDNLKNKITQEENALKQGLKKEYQKKEIWAMIRLRLGKMKLSRLLEKQKRLREELKGRQEKIKEELRRKKAEVQKELENKQAVLKEEVEKEKQELQKERERHNLEIQRIKERLRAKAEEMKKKLENEKNREIHEVLREKTRQIKSQLQGEYQERLKLEVKKKEAVLEQKKIAIEQEIQRKAKALFH